MDFLLDIQKRLIPDSIELMQRRSQILQYISTMQPVGRRSLAVSLGLTERVLRGEVDFLKSQNLIDSAPQGMSLTKEGKDILERLDGIMREIAGIGKLEQRLKEKFGIAGVHVVQGDSDASPWVKRELGKACAMIMKARLKEGDVVAVTGGTTMASVAKMLPPQLSEKNLLFVPARGGLGEDVNNQANTVSAIMANLTNSRHRLFYVPDQVSNEIYESFIEEPQVKEVLALIKSANMVLHGIGDAVTMAKRRNTPQESIEKIIQEKAVGEAFGYYFNESGNIVHHVRTIGLQLEDLANAENIIAAAGGTSKVKAIRAYMKKAPRSTILITDEGAAKLLVQG